MARSAASHALLLLASDSAGGGYAEKVVLDQQALARKPPLIDHVHSAAIALAGQTAWQGLFRHGQFKSGQSVLIHGGSGGVGHFAIQFAKAKALSTNRIEGHLKRDLQCLL